MATQETLRRNLILLKKVRGRFRTEDTVKNHTEELRSFRDYALLFTFTVCVSDLTASMGEHKVLRMGLQKQLKIWKGLRVEGI